MKILGAGEIGPPANRQGAQVLCFCPEKILAAGGSVEELAL